MNKKRNNKKAFDLEERTLAFAKAVLRLCQKLPKNVGNNKLIGQLVDASGSVGANYREANKKLSKKDFIYRMKVTRKECKESTYWLELVKEVNNTLKTEIIDLINESLELRKHSPPLSISPSNVWLL